jgi:hypothetical protein
MPSPKKQSAPDMQTPRFHFLGQGAEEYATPLRRDELQGK